MVSLSKGIFRKFKTGFSKLGSQANRDLLYCGQNKWAKQTVSGKTKAASVLGGCIVVNPVGWAVESKCKSHPVLTGGLSSQELFGPDFQGISK